MSTSDVREQVTTELPLTNGAATETPPVTEPPVAAQPAEPAPPADPETPWTPPAYPPEAEAPRRSLRPSWFHVAGLLGALVVGFVLYLLLITGPLQARSQSHLINEFRSELQTQQTTALLGDPQNNTPPADGSPVALISIPQLGMTQVTVQGISSADTKLGPGHYPSSVLPGQAGNAVIVCRRMTFGGPCANLGGLADGNLITAVTAQGRFTYEVTQISNNVALGSTKPTVQTKDSVLTLISAASSFNPDKEWVVAAKLLGTKGFQSAISLPLPAADVQPGKSTLTGAWGPILLWGELLLTAIVITWVLYRRRFAPAVTYLLTTPPLIALAYLFYGALAMLLPPSL